MAERKRSAAAKGAYYKAKTRKHLAALGYQVGDLEVLRQVHVPGRVVHVKRDQFASDLLAVSADAVVFVQVKLTRHNVAAARREFARFVFPASPVVRRWIVVWQPGRGVPEVIDVRD